MSLKQVHFYNKKIYRYLYIIIFFFIILSLFWHGLGSNRLETNLTGLLPHDSSFSLAHQVVEKKINQRLNRDLILLVGGTDKPKVEEAAQTLQNKIQNSGLFERVSGKVFPDIKELRNNIEAVQVASLSDNEWDNLSANIQEVFSKQAQVLINPFYSNGVVPIQDDWLGLSTLVLRKINKNHKVDWDAQTGWLTINDGNQIWVLIRAQLPEKSGLINVPNQILSVVNDSQTWAKQQNMQLLVAGGSLFAAENKMQGEQESLYMSVLGIGITLLLLGYLFKTPRILIFLLPLCVGLSMGIAITILLLGKIHILTLVVGTSLVGVLLDFPLHWLVAGILSEKWQRIQSLHITAKAFLLSLLITLLGYIILMPTPLPILQQTAVFSVAALISTFIFNVLFLPVLFKNWKSKPNQIFLRGINKVSSQFSYLGHQLFSKPYFIIILCLIMIGGVIQLNTKDDIRQWVVLSPFWLQQAQKVAQLTNVEPSSQYFLITASSDDQLLEKNQYLTNKLIELQKQGEIKNIDSLSQWIVNTTIQEKRKHEILEWAQTPSLWRSLSEVGVDNEMIKQYLESLAKSPNVSIADALKGDIATNWQDLYLGKIENGNVGAWVSISGVKNWELIKQLANPKIGIYFVDQRNDLNQLFAKVRNGAIILKIISYVIAIGILVFIFGFKRGLSLFSVPILATLLTITVFGYMGWTLSLFAIFGLFLVTAVGMDYAIYVSVKNIEINERVGGVILSALTTFISFAIIGFSSTPAVASFGRSVALGVFFSVLIALGMLLHKENIDARV